MASNALFEKPGSRLLTAPVLDFVLGLEMKRAVRAQILLTVIVIEVTREWTGMSVAADQQTLWQLADVVAEEVRETDFLGRTEEAVFSVVLLDADFESSTRVVERIVSHLRGYEFSTALRLVVGGASFPEHASDSATLMSHALSHPIVNWRTTDQRES